MVFCERCERVCTFSYPPDDIDGARQLCIALKEADILGDIFVPIINRAAAAGHHRTRSTPRTCCHVLRSAELPGMWPRAMLALLALGPAPAAAAGTGATVHWVSEPVEPGQPSRRETAILLTA